MMAYADIVQPVQAKIPVLALVAYSGSGKTTLLSQVLPLLKQQGLMVGMIKHCHHRFDIDQPGKDSYVLRKAGVDQMLVASNRRWALMTETPALDEEPDLDALLSQLDQKSLDLILLEGFKHACVPKIEVHRPLLGKPLLCTQDEQIIAVATDQPISLPRSVNLLNLNEPEQVAEFIVTEVFSN
jgi:molybdopterin-guanine dinucleotide biosynthesis adapter protein